MQMDDRTLDMIAREAKLGIKLSEHWAYRLPPEVLLEIVELARSAEPPSSRDWASAVTKKEMGTG